MVGVDGKMDDYVEIARGEFDGTTGDGGVFFPFNIPDDWKPGDLVRIHLRGVFGPGVLGIEHVGEQTPNTIDKTPQSVV